MIINILYSSYTAVRFSQKKKKNNNNFPLSFIEKLITILWKQTFSENRI